MTDPLSIAASVGGLALLARDIVKQVASVISTFRGATSQLQALRHSVALLYGYLESLDLMLDDQDDSPAPLSILACNQTLDKIQGILEKCRAEQEPPASNSTPTSSTSSAKHKVWHGVKQKVQWMIDKDEVEKLLDDLEKHKSVLSLALSKNSLSSIIEVLRKQDETLQHMQEIKKEQSKIRQQQIQDNERRLSEERREMLSTVSQMRPEDSFKKHFSLHQDGTGVWFLESPKFEKFMSTPNSALWVYGIPGAGKSVLSATIIDHISTQRTEHVALAYFFCEYFKTATQTCRNIFGSIARQLALQNPKALEALERFFNDETNLGQSDFNPEDEELIMLIGQMSASFDNTIIVIDGLDECQENRAAVVESLAHLSRDRVGTIKTLFASRKESDIQECLSSFDSLAIAASKADVRLYVAAQLKSRFRKMCEKDPALSEQILTVLVEKSEGMFQWVRCQIDCLANLASNKQRRKALEDLPRDLHGTYERILLRAIKLSQHVTIEFVERTLRWIALAKSPLSVAEITHAISVEVEDRSFDDSMDMDVILPLCSSLVREVDGKLAFSHFSVKEYLMQISPEQDQIARFRISDSDHSFLAQTCLTYLLLDDFDSRGCMPSNDLRPVDDERRKDDWIEDPYPRYPFYNYAAFTWMHHAKGCSLEHSTWMLLKDLFHPTKKDQFLFWAHLQLMKILPHNSPRKNLSRKMYDITPLHLACIFSFKHLLDTLLRHGAEVNAISAVLGSPLQCAISKRFRLRDYVVSDEDRRETVRRLLKASITKDQSRYDPLADALGQNDEEMASILLEHGFTLTISAAAEWKSKKAPNFLLRADLKNLDPEVELFLKKKFRDFGLLISPQENQGCVHQSDPLPSHLEHDYKDAIKASCRHGRLENVKDLLSRQESLNGDRLSAFLSRCLIEAAAQGHAGVVQYLVGASADLAFQRQSDARTALHVASRRCHVDVVRILLEMSDDKKTISGIQDRSGLTPWMCAIEAGSIETLELFLTDPSTVNLRTTTKNGQTAAHLAAQTCNEQMVSYLRDLNVDFTCLNTLGKAPIHALLELYLDGSEDDHYDDKKHELLRRMFLNLQQDSMLCIQMQSGQTLVHLIAQMRLSAGKRLWQVIQDNQIFDDTRSQSLTITDLDGNTPLHHLVQNLIERFPDTDADTYSDDDDYYDDPFDDFYEFVQLLSTGNAGSEQFYMRNDSGRTPVMELAESLPDSEIPDFWTSEQILSVFRGLGGARTSRCPFGMADNDKRTVLHYLAQCKYGFPSKEVTEYILEGSIDVAAKDSSGQCALLLAAQEWENNVDFMRLLIPRMSFYQLEEKDSSGSTILHYICNVKKEGVQDLVKDLLLEPIAKCEKRDPDGRIPLTHAPSIITDDTVASRLIQLADETIDICDDAGKACMYWSCELGSIAMVSAFLDAGAHIDAPLGPDSESEMSAPRDPPLLIAARCEQFEMVEFLLDRGAAPLVKGAGCWQLHHHAFASGSSYELLDILEKLTGFDYDAKAELKTSYAPGEEDASVSEEDASVCEEDASVCIEDVSACIKDATPLHFVADSGDKQDLQWLIDHNKVSNVNVETWDGSTPLILASLNGHHSMCKKLIKLGGLISKARYDGYTALHAACQYGHLDICKLLIATESGCLFQNFEEQTPLGIAAENGHKDIVELLLLLEYEAHVTVGAEINALKAGHHDIAEILRRKLSIGNTTSAGNAAVELDAMRLSAACDTSSESTLIEVLQKNVNPNIRLPDTHETPLHVACREGWKEAIELLMERDADMEALDEEGHSPLMVAVESRQVECTELLCRKGAQTTTRDIYGWTVLHEAADLDDFDSLSYFIKQGLEANVQTYDGDTPLHLTSIPECVELLLEYGADPFLVGLDNETVAWRYCYCEGGADLLSRIFRNQPTEKVQQSIEAFSSRQLSTSLYRAAFLGNSDAVSTLIEYGAKVNGRCGPLGAPIHAALRQGHVEIATTLLKNGARPYRIVRDGEENPVWFWEYGYDFCLQGRNGVWESGSL